MSEVKVNLSKQEFAKNLKLSPRAMIEAKDFWIKRVQRVTRSGKYIVTGNKLKKLSKAYIDFRRKFSGRTGEFFKPAKSNLTFTGQLLESLKARSNVRTQVITLFVSGRRDDGLTNKEVAEHVAENGRPFLGIDQKGIDRIEQIGKRDIRRNWAKRRR
ncbi:MAG: hypothetical protein ACPGES_03740 [Coraliomargarita sp.]